MDITETLAAGRGISSGVSVALVGRWFMGLLRGQFSHTNILNSPALPGEIKMGWAFHLVIGGGGVALLYPLFFHALKFALADNHLLAGMFFGLATSLLPWFILLPSFGWGLFGSRGPQGSNALLASTLSHIPYGFGVGAVVALGLTRNIH